MPNKVPTRETSREKRERPDKGPNIRNNHHHGEIDTHKGRRDEGERPNQDHGSEPEHNVPYKRDETVEDNQ